MSKSTDDGQTWTRPVRISGGATNDKIDRYNVTVAADNGKVHVAWRQRDESGKVPLFSPVIDTYYRESRDGGKTWTPPLQVNIKASNPYHGAFSRNGTFEGDYNQTASAGGYTYITRAQGEPVAAGEPRALVPNPDSSSSDTLVLNNAGKAHQHQRNWVAVVRDLAPGAKIGLPKNCIDRRKFRFRLHRAQHSRVVSVDVYVNGKRRLHRKGHSIKRVTIKKLPKKKRFTVKIVTHQSNGSISVSTRRYKGCHKSHPHTKGKHKKKH